MCVQELKLQRKAIIVLAFIASSGQSGFEILLKPVTQKGDNFLELVIQILSLEIGAEGDSVTKSQEFVNERYINLFFSFVTFITKCCFTCFYLGNAHQNNLRKCMTRDCIKYHFYLYATKR